MDLLILGAGSHGRVVREIAMATGKYSKVAFLDDNYDGTDPEVIGKLSDYERFKCGFGQAFIAIGNPIVREQWHIKLFDLGYTIPILVHPDAYISPSACIGAGTVVMPKAAIQTNTKIGKGCIVSAGAVVDHDAVIGDFCHINSGAVVAAGSEVPNGMKVDYNEVYKNHSAVPVADKELKERYKKDFGTEISFF